MSGKDWIPAEIRAMCGKGNGVDLVRWRQFVKRLTGYQLDWLKHKCNWEKMPRIGVALEWGIPSAEECEEEMKNDSID